MHFAKLTTFLQNHDFYIQYNETLTLDIPMFEKTAHSLVLIKKMYMLYKYIIFI